MIKIEKGIPIPPIKMGQYKGGQGPTDFTNAFRKMESGDSFEIEKEKTDIMTTISRLKAKEGIGEFTIRKTGKFKYRIWKL